MARLQMRAFAVYVDKMPLEQSGDLNRTRWLVWESLTQRLSITHDRDDLAGKTPMMLMHDEGEELTIRRYA